VTAVAGRSRGDGTDAHISARLRELRMAAGLSERVLGDLINVTRQQVHNDEAGANRITAARLYYITQALKVDIGAFFEGLPGPQRRAPNSACSSIWPGTFGQSTTPSIATRCAG
jgi:transcriptional regulator with XRE-family HTH domain